MYKFSPYQGVRPTLQKVELTSEEAKTGEVYIIAEGMPQLPGGDEELRIFIYDNLKYPIIAQENGIQVKVIVSYIINEDGSESNARVVRSIDPSLDVEALRLINLLPKYATGRDYKGNPVRVQMTLLISFQLQ